MQRHAMVTSSHNVVIDRPAGTRGAKAELRQLNTTCPFSIGAFRALKAFAKLSRAAKNKVGIQEVLKVCHGLETALNQPLKEKHVREVMMIASESAWIPEVCEEVGLISSLMRPAPGTVKFNVVHILLASALLSLILAPWPRVTCTSVCAFPCSSWHFRRYPWTPMRHATPSSAVLQRPACFSAASLAK